MMPTTDYASTPLAFEGEMSNLNIRRDISNLEQMINNFIELIVFTPRGSCKADPDFGFEYWNHEYANVRSREFNNGQTLTNPWGEVLYNEVTRLECEDSVKRSINTYLPMLQEVEVALTLNEENFQRSHHVYSKYEMAVVVTGKINEGLNVNKNYRKTVKFLMEPTVKNIRL